MLLLQGSHSSEHSNRPTGSSPQDNTQPPWGFASASFSPSPQEFQRLSISDFMRAQKSTKEHYAGVSAASSTISSVSGTWNRLRSPQVQSPRRVGMHASTSQAVGAQAQRRRTAFAHQSSESMRTRAANLIDDHASGFADDDTGEGIGSTATLLLNMQVCTRQHV
jgi:hypothetical protein